MMQAGLLSLCLSVCVGGGTGRDVYYRRAKQDGYRARSAYKLLQLDERFGFFGPDTRRVVDLCAAPGSWSQVVRTRLAAAAAAADARKQRNASQAGAATEMNEEEASAVATKTGPTGRTGGPADDPSTATVIVAIDLQEMAPIEGVHLLRGDITAASTACRVLELFSGSKAQVVLCDGAPDVTGMRDMDEQIQVRACVR
eukprot:GHVU01047707.1.p1 GENE.GHVU01047707.1~~GHVU01047707.1.p1  ORF type:complete len:199 (-),score=36.05 GHVU01047707.1:1039-1635(-)